MRRQAELPVPRFQVTSLRCMARSALGPVARNSGSTVHGQIGALQPHRPCAGVRRVRLRRRCRLRTRSRSWTAGECRVPAQIPRVDVLSRYDFARESALMVDDDIWALTNTVQDALRARHRGYHPRSKAPTQWRTFAGTSCSSAASTRYSQCRSTSRTT